jgi:hypothetical protein
MKIRIAFLSSLLLFGIPLLASAHGALQKVVEGKYLVNFTPAPFAPTVGKEQQNMLALSDFQENLIEKNSIFNVEIRKDEKAVFRVQNQVAKGGLLPFSYTYEEPGEYELFITFKIPGDSNLYEPDHFMIEVLPKPISRGSLMAIWLAIGLAVGLLIRRRQPRRRRMS